MLGCLTMVMTGQIFAPVVFGLAALFSLVGFPNRHGLVLQMPTNANAADAAALGRNHEYSTDGFYVRSGGVRDLHDGLRRTVRCTDTP